MMLTKIKIYLKIGLVAFVLIYFLASAWIYTDRQRLKNEMLTAVTTIERLEKENNDLIKDRQKLYLDIKNRDAVNQELSEKVRIAKNELEKIYDRDKDAKEWADVVCPVGVSDFIDCLLQQNKN